MHRIAVRRLEPLESRLALSAGSPDAVLGAYVAGLYQDLLQRPADPASRAYWVSRIEQGEPIDRVATSVAHSSEHYVALIDATYRSVLGRAPDPVGLNFWTAACQAGLSDEQLEASLLATDEFYERAGSTDQAFVNGAYESLFQRPADALAEGFWAAWQQAGLSRSVIAESLTHSVEREQGRVEDAYAEVLHSPGDAAGIAYWTAQLMGGLSNENLLVEFATSGAYFKQQTGQPITAVPLPSDFGNWSSETAAIDARIGRSNPDVLFIGDSITENWTDGPGAAVWNQVYGSRNAVQAGIFGDETQGVLWRLEHTALARIQPKLVVLLIGTNNLTEGDSPADVATGIEAIVRTLRQNYPDARVLLMGVLPRGATAGDPFRQAAAATNQLIAGLADGGRVGYVDLGPSLLYPDGTFQAGVMLPGLIHLDTLGYQKWAAAIEPFVRAAVG